MKSGLLTGKSEGKVLKVLVSFCVIKAGVMLRSRFPAKWPLVASQQFPRSPELRCCWLCSWEFKLLRSHGLLLPSELESCTA